MLPIVLLCAALIGGPTLPPSTPSGRLAHHIVDVSPSAAPYAVELAQRILSESAHYRLDPALLAAIGYAESRWRMYPRGKPGTHLAGLWQVYPTAHWLTIPRRERMRLSRSVVVSTGRAALILARHVGSGPHSPARYCRYNRTPCRRGYIVALYRRARIIRAVLQGRHAR